jgi:hypothetical protein
MKVYGQVKPWSNNSSCNEQEEEKSEKIGKYRGANQDDMGAVNLMGVRRY